MIAEAGLAALWLAASMALIQFIAGLTLLRAGTGLLVPLIKPAAYCVLRTYVVVLCY